MHGDGASHAEGDLAQRGRRRVAAFGDVDGRLARPYTAPVRSAVVVLGVALTACGGLASEPDQRAVLATVHGTITDTSGVAAGSLLRAAVVWRGAFNRASEVVVAGGFPAGYQVELRGAPPAGSMYEQPYIPGHIAYGAIVVYEDLNANQRLDLVDYGAIYIDRVIGISAGGLIYSDEQILFDEEYADGTPMRDGYALITVDAGCKDACKGGYFPIEMPLDLELSSDPKFAEVMCAQPVDSSRDDIAQIPSTGRPGAGYPVPGDSSLHCSTDGSSYSYTGCPPDQQGLCRKRQCPTQSYARPDPVPSDWPCPAQ